MGGPVDVGAILIFHTAVATGIKRGSRAFKVGQVCHSAELVCFEIPDDGGGQVLVIVASPYVRGSSVSCPQDTHKDVGFVVHGARHSTLQVLRPLAAVAVAVVFAAFAHVGRARA